MSTASASPLHKIKSNSPVQKYISNPFYVLVEGTTRLFNTNQVAAIFIVFVGFILGVIQFISEIFRMIIGSLNTSDTPPVQTTTAISNVDPSISGWAIASIALIVIGVVVVIVIISTLWSVFYNGLIAYVAVCTLHNKKARFGEGISMVGSHFWKLLLATILVQLKVIGGLLLFIIPGIRALLRYDLTYIMILDKNIKPLAAMNALKAITKGRLIEIFGVKSLAGMVPFVSSVVLLGGQIKQYEQLSLSYNNANMERGEVHWLNYIAFLLIGGFVFFVALASLIILIVARAS